VKKLERYNSHLPWFFFFKKKRRNFANSEIHREQD
jgi:hypothetical protein